jgi:hypothetical protein
MRWALACMAILFSGCAMRLGSPLDEHSPGVRPGNGAQAAAAQARLRAGSTKGEVSAALGRANVVTFDSGWEVWVYRWPGADGSTRSATELVVLFDAAGVLRKSRIRTGA